MEKGVRIFARCCVLGVATLLLRSGYCQQGEFEKDRKFLVVMSFGATIGEGAPGFLFSLEPKYRVAELTSLGLLAQSNEFTSSLGGDQIKLFGAGSIHFTIDRDLWSDSGYRYFVGAGIGFVSFSYGDSDHASSFDRASGMVRLGAAVLRLTVTAELIATRDIHFGSIKIGIAISGRRRKVLEPTNQ